MRTCKMEFARAGRRTRLNRWQGVCRVTRLSVWVVWLALLDCVLFIAVWAFDGVESAHGIHTWYGLPVYLLTALCGLLLAIWGFVALTRGSSDQLRHASTCVVLSMVPGCAALIFVLSHLHA